MSTQTIYDQRTSYPNLGQIAQILKYFELKATIQNQQQKIQQQKSKPSN